jgi:amidohydrolase
LNDVPYKSQTPGLMHACGHDAYTASCSSASPARCSERRSDLHGTVKFAFQPAEENVGGPSPTSYWVRWSIPTDAAFGIHIAQDLPVGTVGVIHGPMTPPARGGDHDSRRRRARGATAPRRSVVIAGSASSRPDLVSRRSTRCGRRCQPVRCAGSVSNVIGDQGE